MSLSIRPAGLQDIQTIRTLAHDIWPKAYGTMISRAQRDYMLNWMYSPESLRQQMEAGHQFLLLETESGEALGYAAYCPLSDTQWKLEKLYVRVEMHGQGLGKTLLENVMERIRQKGPTHLELQVNRTNPAVGFYHKMGFQILREADFEIGNGFWMNDYIMGRPVQ